MAIRIFVSRTSGNFSIKKEQEYIKRILECKKIRYEEVDIADPLRAGDKAMMYETLRSSGVQMRLQVNPDDDDSNSGLPPQLFNGNRYRGDFHGFFDAVESETLFQYLALDVPKNEVEYSRRMGNINQA